MEIGSGSSESSTVEQVPPHNNNNINNHENDDGDNQDNQMVGIAYEYEGCDESSELELGLGLSLGGNVNKTDNHNNLNHNHGVLKNEIKQQIRRILTAKDLGCARNVVSGVGGGGVVSPPSSASSCSSLGLRPPTKLATNASLANNSNNNKNNNNVSAGTKRAASPTGVSQVVGWPPIRSYRMNSMANQAKSIAAGELNSQFDESKAKEANHVAEDKSKDNSKERGSNRSSLFVKVNMDGVAIGRKVDLTVHSSYASLAQTLEDMFTNEAAEKSNTEELLLMPKVTRSSRLLDGLSEYVLTYEDKDGDWMLVGDVPWGMFVSTVKRLRIMRTSEANGLAPPLEARSAKQRSRPR